MNKHCTYEDWKRCRWGINYLELCGRLVDVLEIGVGPLEISALPYFVEVSGCQSVGVEANPLLAETAALELERTTIVHAACWSEAGLSVELVMNGGSSAVAGLWCPTPNPGGQRVKVPTVTYESVVKEHFFGVHPQLVNIDCEGCEHLVLESMGAMGPGVNGYPMYIGIELWPQYPASASCEKWLLDHGYQPILATGPASETQVWRLG
jgi:FkbM family methyltransferase